MADDDNYDEVEAVVRIPKGERLADSRKTEGWSRGFTPKSSEKGPEHVEIRLKNESESTGASEPKVVYVTEYVDQRARELTPGQQMVVDIAGDVLDAVIEAVKPIVAEWWDTTVIPSVKAKRDGFKEKRRIRKIDKQRLRAQTATEPPAIDAAAKTETSSQPLAAADGPAITMTTEQFQQLFLTWLAREDGQHALWQMIANANIEDDDESVLAWHQGLKELSPEQRTERVQEILVANPSILTALLLQQANRSAVELREPVQSHDEA